MGMVVMSKTGEMVVVTNWIFTFCQPHRVTSGRGSGRVGIMEAISNTKVLRLPAMVETC